MADERLRDLERQATQGAPHAQARLLLERVRVGELDLEMLMLAAYCGDEASQEALKEEVAEVVAPSNLVSIEWFETLERWDEETMVRGAIVAASLAHSWFVEYYREEQRPLQAIAAARQVLVCPCSQHIADAFAASNEAMTFADELAHGCLPNNPPIIGTCTGHLTAYLARAAAHIAASLIGQAIEEIRGDLMETDELIANVVEVAFEVLSTDNQDEQTIDTYRRIQSKIHAGLIPWALGEGDPILDNPTPAELPPEGT